MNKAQIRKAFDLYGRGRTLAIARLEMPKRPDAARHLRWLMHWEFANHELPWLALNEDKPGHGITLLLSDALIRHCLIPRLGRSNATQECGRITLHSHLVSIRKAREFYTSAEFQQQQLLERQLSAAAARAEGKKQ
jgi:hypothetical protein